MDDKAPDVRLQKGHGISEAFDILVGIADGSLVADAKRNRKERAVFKTETKDFVVDTCFTSDDGWETGVKRPDQVWVIVEYYADEDGAREGHERWAADMAENPLRPLASVQFPAGVE